MSEERIRKWMEAAGCKNIRPSGINQLVSTCPFHTNKSGTSFAMRTDNGLFLCYSAGCGVSGNAINFLMFGLGWSFRKAKDATEMMDIPNLENEADFELPDYRDRKKKSDELPNQKMTEGHLGMYDFCPVYMRERGYPKSLLRDWEIGYDYGVMRVTIPVRDDRGKLVGVSKRGVTKHQEPKYLHLGFRKSQYLYGAHKVKGRSIVVTEGQLDVLAWAALRVKYPKLQLPPAVGTMGSFVSNRQIALMGRYDKVILAYDNDPDGIAATNTTGEGLIAKLRPGNLTILRRWPSDCKDLGDVFEKQLSEKAVVRFLTTEERYDDYRLELLDGR